ncbi:YbhB/YbcL family Raf kinase inhibitor-like protein [Enterovibrio sp. ZSDZ42]|uniref:YbhB/YbcL family Raf kinase inhibitor-like protein n=1 Tax=Enterovibrio gelatinilyticus TaxID=2899819 RepID=A0ABT5R5G8_9GAMM|nr:YbhB/YbcL family Raf kinase inhibitor-like protein [Enterovibrio sp. ZSDZ42]MDD1795523.1 YbhB/YbcL family Raf kinase inhibitor-like protein [Enterovibrio sp. ZSDZ42]
MKKTLLIPLITAISFGSHALTLTSNDIQEGTRMADTFAFQGFGCTGDNVSPQLQWKDAPQGTKSFAITAYDPDAPTGSGWWHWVALDIPASQNSVDRGASGKLDGMREMNNDYGVAGFGGACPPKGHGMHRYQFTVWALPTEKLELPSNPSNALIGYMLNASALDSAKLTATYVSE